jgi:hypothetical protein
MPTKFISTFPCQGLYCVWIATGNPRQPLACIWIDPQMRTYELEYSNRVPAGYAKPNRSVSEVEVHQDRHEFVSRPGTPNSPRGHAKLPTILRSCALIVIALSVLVNPAWADVGGRVAGFVADPSAVFLSAATVTLTSTGNGTKQAATTNDQGQYSFPVVSVGKHELEISAPGFQTDETTGIGIDVDTALQIDAVLKIQQSQESMEVSDNVVTVRMSDTEIGETIASQQVVDVPLNGRSDTDLLAAPRPPRSIGSCNTSQALVVPRPLSATTLAIDAMKNP